MNRHAQRLVVITVTCYRRKIAAVKLFRVSGETFSLYANSKLLYVKWAITGYRL